MANDPRERPPQPTARRRTAFRVPELARLRDQALNSLMLAGAGLNEEMSVLDDGHIHVLAEGLGVYIPSVQGRPPRTVPVTYGESRASCPVRCWSAWKEAKLGDGAEPGGPAFLAVHQWGPTSARNGFHRTASAARCAKYTCLSGRRIAGRSARRGLVTTGIKKGRASTSCAARAGGPPTARCCGRTWMRAPCSRTPRPRASVSDRGGRSRRRPTGLPSAGAVWGGS